MPKNYSRVSGSLATVCCLVSLVLAASGCASGVITAQDLPSEFVAPPVHNAQTIDLSRLASYSVSSELIEPGDVLEVTVGAGYAENGAISIPIRVSDNGEANVPLVGKVALAGLELEGAEQTIAAAAVTRGVFRSPFVTVLMDRKRVNKVTVVGAVESPGVFELARSSSDLLAAIVAAGGLSEDAGTQVEVRRPGRRSTFHGHGPGHGQPGSPREAMAPGVYSASHVSPVAGHAPQSVRIDLVAAAHSGDGGVPVGDGDVVMVLKKDPKPVHVMGLVAKPDQYEMPPNQELRVLDALAMAGGVDSAVADKIYVIRRIPGRPEPVVVKVSLRAAKLNGKENVRLAPGDVVSVEQSPATVVLDAVKNFVRFGMSAAVPVF